MRFPNPVVQKVGGGVQRSSSAASGTGSGDSSPLSQAKSRGNSDQKWSKSGRALNWWSSIFAHSVSSSSNIGEVRMLSTEGMAIPFDEHFSARISRTSAA